MQVTAHLDFRPAGRVMKTAVERLDAGQEAAAATPVGSALGFGTTRHSALRPDAILGPALGHANFHG